MKEILDFTKESANNRTMSPLKKDVLSLKELCVLVSNSYLHVYGILIRLAIFYDLSIPELLGLQWSDLDMEKQGLHIRYTYNSGARGYELRKKSEIRFVHLPSWFFKELADLHEEQLNTLVRYRLVSHSNSIATTLKGHQILPWLMDYYFSQIFEVCGIPECAYSTLHDSYVCNSVEDRMWLKQQCKLINGAHAE